jgi:pimeloyl-ACP methyl ester carboxylesterase
MATADGVTVAVETILGCRVRMMRKGAGEPLLFLHGASGAARWLPFMDRLAERFDVIVPEHPGFGGSDMPDWLDTISDMAFYYLDLIDWLKVGPAHVMGTSLGGWIAAEMAVRNGTPFRSLMLVAPAGLHVAGVKRPDIFLMSPEDLAANLVYDAALAAALPQPQTEDEVMTMLKNRLATAKLGWSPRMHSPDLPKWLHRIRVPVQIVWGAEDRILPVAYAAAWQRRIPHARLTILPACGHLPHLEQAETFVALALGFMKGDAMQGAL